MAYKNTGIEGDLAVRKDVTVGRNVNVRAQIKVERDLVVGGALISKYVNSANMGLYTTEEDLQRQHPDPKKGQYAGVGGTMPAVLYVCKVNGAWEETAGQYKNEVTASEWQNIYDTYFRNDLDTKIDSGNVKESDIVEGAVTTDKIADGAVTADKLAVSFIGSEQIVDGAVTGDKIADGAITQDKFADGSIESEKIADNTIKEQKIADGAISFKKVSPEVMSALKAATGMPEDMIELLGNVGERLDALEGGKLTVTVRISGGAVIEYTAANTYSGTISYGITPDPAAATTDFKVTSGATTIDEGSAKSGTKVVQFSGVGNHTYTINGSASYKGVTKNATAQSTTFSVCKRSYIGYSSAENYSGVNLSSLTSVLSTSGVRASERNVTNSGGSAYLWIAIPKNGNAAGVTKIEQLGVLTVDIPFTTYSEDSNYTYYRSNSKHNAGSYRFKIS